MHNDLAWAVLGVDPATGEVVEDAARKRGASIGRLLELMLAESRAACERTTHSPRISAPFRLIGRAGHELLRTGSFSVFLGRPPNQRPRIQDRLGLCQAHVPVLLQDDELYPVAQELPDSIARALARLESSTKASPPRKGAAA